MQSSTPAANQPATISAANAAPATGPTSAAVEDPKDSSAPTPTDGKPYAWKNVEMLGGGFVSGVIWSRAEAGLAYARTDIGGAYRFEPKDSSWIPITDWVSRDDANFMGVESLALDPTDPNKVYLASGTYTADWAGTAAMLRSNDRGKTFEVTKLSFKMGGNENGRSNGERLVVDPNQPKTLLFGSRKDGLWRSDDGSVTWNKVEFPSFKDDKGIGINIVLFDQKSGVKGKPTPVIYASVANSGGPGLFVSKNAGKSWEPLAEQPKFLASHAELDRDGNLYLSYGDGPGPNDIKDGAVFRYEPRTKKFVDITPIKPAGADTFGYGGLGVDAKRAGTLIVSTIDRWGAKDEIFRSTDAGKSWKKLSPKAVWDVNGAQYLYWGRKEPLHTPHWMGDIDIDPFNPDRASFVTGAGIWLTTNLTGADREGATTWKFSNKGLEETAVLSVVSPPVGPPLFSGVGDICGFRHEDLDRAPPEGFYMNPTCNGTTGIDFAERRPEIMARVGRVWGSEKRGAHSNDGGKTWTPFAAEPKNAAQGGLIALTSDGKSFLWAGKQTIPAYSIDRGATWREVRGVREGIKLADWANFDLQPAADRVNPNTVYLYDAHKGAFYASFDGGVSFSPTFKGFPELADWQLAPASIQATPGFEGHVWVTTGKGLYRTKDSGRTFSAIRSVDESYGIGVGKAAPGRSYPALYLAGQVGGKKGFFRSDDIGTTWVRINDDTHQFGYVNIVEGDPRVYGRVYLGTSGRGVIYGGPQN